MEKKIFLPIVIFIYLFSYSKIMANEEASYDIVHKTDIYEVRYYSDRLVAQIVETNDRRSFRQLFNYISGGNSNDQKIEMTIPVARTKKDNKFFMQFFLPSIFTIETAPIPSNPNIEINTIEKGYFAVIRYSRRPSDKNFDKNVQILKKEILKDKLLIIGSPIRATYDSPFTLPFSRRNEVMFKINWNKWRRGRPYFHSM